MNWGQKPALTIIDAPQTVFLSRITALCDVCTSSAQWMSYFLPLQLLSCISLRIIIINHTTTAANNRSWTFGSNLTNANVIKLQSLSPNKSLHFQFHNPVTRWIRNAFSRFIRFTFYTTSDPWCYFRIISNNSLNMNTDPTPNRKTNRDNTSERRTWKSPPISVPRFIHPASCIQLHVIWVIHKKKTCWH